MPRVTRPTGIRGQYTVLREIESPHENRPTRHYQIREGGDGVVYCTCPGYRFRRTCRHMDQYNQELAQEEAHAAFSVDRGDVISYSVRGRPITPGQSIPAELGMNPGTGPTPSRTVRTAWTPQFDQEGRVIPRVKPIKTKHYEVYDEDKLLGIVTGESSEQVLGRFTRTSKNTDKLTVKQVRTQ